MKDENVSVWKDRSVLCFANPMDWCKQGQALKIDLGLVWHVSDCDWIRVLS